MTSKDKSSRPGSTPESRDRKPRAGAPDAAGKKSFGGGKPPAGKPPAGKRDGKPFAKTFADKAAPSRDARPAPVRAKAAPGASSDVELVPERISKLLARAGIASRRDVERMIMEGRVSLNGKVLETPVVNATLADHIEVDGDPIRGIERTRLWLYHKPAGLVTTNADPEGRPTVFENLPEDLPRVMSIGRLDINTEGLLLLTNDGGLARVLELPATGWLRRYRVRAHGTIEQATLDTLKEGIAVDGVLYGAIDATLDKVQGSNVWLTLSLREGKNREVKNVLGSLGLDVNRLIRISYGPFQLGELPEGHAQEIRGRTLRDQLGPRLVEQAKANFDAPLFEHGAIDAEEAPAVKPKAADTGWERGNRDKPADRRETARGRLDTKRDDRFGDKRGESRDSRPPSEDRFEARPKRPPAGSRKSNVWMAPGARPVAEKKKGEEAAAGPKREPRERPEGAPKVKRYGRTLDGSPTKTAHKFDPDRKGPSRGGPDRRGPSAGRPMGDGPTKPRILKTRDAEGEWISATGEPESDGGFKKRGPGGDSRGARDFGDRPARKPFAGGERSFGDRPRTDRKPSGEGERSFGDRPPRTDRKPFGEGERSFGDRPPRTDRKPSGEGARPFGDRPPRRDGGKPFGKPAGGKPFGGKPSGSKPSGGKPSGGKPSGGRPFGGKPGGGSSFGGKPPAGGRPRGRGK